MASAFHCFGSQHNSGTVTCVQSGGIRRGKWILLQGDENMVQKGRLMV